jgi:short-subunit dehydrogenase
MSQNDTSFVDRYGPWALVAGASEGVGAAFAHAVAERGVNVVLLARRQGALDDVAASIRADTGVDTRTVALDLAESGAMAAIAEATAGLELGLLMYNAGADPNYEPFLAGSVDVALGLVQRNCIVPMQLCHHVAGPMAARGTGGIILVSSGAGLVGAPNMVAYAASKAFDMVMAEALWAELHDQGVDVLGLVLGATDTPALRRLLARRGLLASPESTTPIPGAATAAEVAAAAIANLSNGPTFFMGEQLQEGARHLGGMARNDAVALMIQAGAGLMDTPIDTLPDA